jgi:2,3-bisphosphoglycerate-dependent phosphoglycerate mutase
MGAPPPPEESLVSDTSTLVLLRHGESEWNLANLFTGWVDVDLTDTGRAQATGAGREMRAAGLTFDIVHTSVLVRAVRTANLALDEMGQVWLPARRHWRLNERHYGKLQGLDKAETRAKYGDEQLLAWRRSYDTPPPPVDRASEHHPANDPRYRFIPADALPASECLADVVERMLPYWYDAIVPDLQTGAVVLVVAHGNSLRALIKHLDGISDADIAGLDIPTGVPLRYELGPDLMPVEELAPLDRALGDVEAAKAAAEAVKRQAERPPPSA